MSSTITSNQLMSRQSFSRFGDDLAQLILSYLPIDAKFRHQFLSRQFRRVLFDTQTDLRFDDKLVENFGLKKLNRDVHLFEAIVKKCPNITRIVLDYKYLPDLTNYYMYLMIKHCHRLKHLTVGYNSECSGRLMDSLSRSYVKRFFRTFAVQLKSFEIDIFYEPINKWFGKKHIQRFQSLEKLSLAPYYYDAHKFCEETRHPFTWILPPTLRSVSLEVSTQYLKYLSVFVANYDQKITALSVKLLDFHENFLLIPSLAALLSRFRLLNKLTLRPQGSYFRQFPKYIHSDYIIDLIRDMGANCPLLKSVTVDGININDTLFTRLIDTIARHMHRLRQLNLHVITSVENMSQNMNPLLKSSMKKLPQLTHFSLRCYATDIPIDDKFFDDIHLQLPRLQYLDLRDCSLTAQTMRSLAKLKHLRAVRLYGCLHPPVSVNVITDELIRKQANITSVFISYRFPSNIFIHANTDLRILQVIAGVVTPDICGIRDMQTVLRVLQISKRSLAITQFTTNAIGFLVLVLVLIIFYDLNRTVNCRIIIGDLDYFMNSGNIVNTIGLLSGILLFGSQLINYLNYTTANSCTDLRVLQVMAGVVTPDSCGISDSHTVVRLRYVCKLSLLITRKLNTVYNEINDYNGIYWSKFLALLWLSLGSIISMLLYMV
ncbi:uncharacterized protein LOC128963196 [Oppia nitens]|uniref:uncharacterized protein LOC128963196 n=1 Tax=Oppia nitens TaxID=1686743 RepID=UPI0023DAFE3C|nr:uncharacterized protein LOC128963196 [Oppia nitens]